MNISFKDYLLTEAAKKAPKPKKPKARPRKNLWFTSTEFWVDDLQFDKGEIKYHEDEEENIYATDPNGEMCYGYWNKAKNGGMTFATGRPFSHYSTMKATKEIK